MTHRHAQSGLLISIDLEHIGEVSPHARQRAASICQQLLDTFDRLRVSATWGLADPGKSVLARSINARRTTHEIAVVADTAWNADRVVFSRELGRRVEHARGVGIRVSSLFTSQLEIGSYLDLLVKNRIRVVRSEGAANEQWQAHSERYGVWEPPRPLDLTHAQPWWLGGSRSVRRCINRAVEVGETCHFRVDVAQAIDRQLEIRGFEAALRVAAARVSRGEMLSTTLGHQVAQLGFVRNSGPARSILRAA
ncbi:MAG: hypothetical protein QGG36_12960 [Pirellulaceae bacterium]|jgi:hypothetical protein|nr:hypothetical protein [Pirellulaceae bacterium]MDP7016706.1 hypothetical protein [Pirellulaceae bacterium]